MYKRELLCVILCAVCAACSGNVRSTAGTAAVRSEESIVEIQSPDIEELPLPQLPDTLRQPAERAAFIIEHFWDKMDFCDTLRSHSEIFVEQNFANFVSVFPYAGQDARVRAVDVLLRSAQSDKEAYLLMADVAEKYLYDPNSPMLNEEFYSIFIDGFLSSPILDRYEKMRYDHQRDAVRKNRPGVVAANFSYIDRNGVRTTLHSTAAGSELLVVFYDPDCEHCKEIIGHLRSHPVLSQIVNGGEMKVLAVYSGEERELWDSTKNLLPEEWAVGYDTTGIEEKGLYVLRAMPTIYLLDGKKKVVFKDIPMEMLFDYLEQAY